MVFPMVIVQEFMLLLMYNEAYSEMEFYQVQSRFYRVLRYLPSRLLVELMIYKTLTAIKYNFISVNFRRRQAAHASRRKERR